MMPIEEQIQRVDFEQRDTEWYNDGVKHYVREIITTIAKFFPEFYSARLAVSSDRADEIKPQIKQYVLFNRGPLKDRELNDNNN